MDLTTPNRAFEHQLKIKQGDTVVLTAISTMDDWHGIRHSLLHRTYIVDMEPRQATPGGGYGYRNWVTITLSPVGKDGRPIKIQSKTSFHFAKVQLMKVKPVIPVVRHIRIERMLLDINAEINNEPKILHTPLDPNSSHAWYKLFLAGKEVQAKRLDGGIGKWYKAGNATFRDGLKREFRLKEQ